MLQIGTMLFDLIFPPRDTEMVLRTLYKEMIVSLYTKRQYNDVQYLLEYHHPTVQALIKENKFHQNKHASLLLAEVLKTHIQSKNVASLCFIPIPLSAKRLRTRGYNQVTEILKLIPSVPTEHTLLIRSSDTTPQTGLQRDQRLKNMVGAFTVNTSLTDTYKDTTLILIDDVVTTGATLKEAKAALAPHLHPTTTVVCLALAH